MEKSSYKMCETALDEKPRPTNPGNDESQALVSRNGQAQVANRPKLSLKILPTDILLYLMGGLDPVTQRCLGLTSKGFQNIFYLVYQDPITRTFNHKKHPFSLNLQASIDGEHLLNWKFEDWHLAGSTDIVWGLSLGELLRGEWQLWGGLICCSNCGKYKPTSAYDSSLFEIKFLKRPDVQKETDAMEREDVEWYQSMCRRCRARTLLMVFEKRREYFDERELGFHRPTSLGLSYKMGRTEIEKKRDIEGARGDSAEEFHAAEHDYETWDRLFKRLNI